MNAEVLGVVLTYITYGGAVATLCVAARTLYRHQQEKKKKTVA